MTIVLRRKWEMNLDLFGYGSKSLKLTPKWIGRLNISELGNPFHALILNHSHLLSTNPILHHIQNGRLGHQQRHSSEILGVNCKSGIFHPWVLDVHVLKVQVPPAYFRNRTGENLPQTFKSTFQEDRVLGLFSASSTNSTTGTWKIMVSKMKVLSFTIFKFQRSACQSGFPLCPPRFCITKTGWLFPVISHGPRWG